MNKKKMQIATVDAPLPADVVEDDRLPPILLAHATPEVRHKVETFYSSVADIFERWVARRDSRHTQRAYRQDVMALVNFLKLIWPDDATSLLTVSVGDIQD